MFRTCINPPKSKPWYDGGCFLCWCGSGRLSSREWINFRKRYASSKKTGGMFEVRRWGTSPFEEHLLGSVIHSKYLGGIASLLRLRISFYQPYLPLNKPYACQDAKASGHSCPPAAHSIPPPGACGPCPVARVGFSYCRWSFESYHLPEEYSLISYNTYPTCILLGPLVPLWFAYLAEGALGSGGPTKQR